MAENSLDIDDNHSAMRSTLLFSTGFVNANMHILAAILNLLETLPYSWKAWTEGQLYIADMKKR